MSFYNRIMAAYKGFTDPDSIAGGKPADKLDEYRLRYAYYKSEMFKPGVVEWKTVCNDPGLYQHTRLLFNPVPNVVKFYEDNIWGQAQNALYPQLSLPVIDAGENLYKVLAVLDQWTNWRTEQFKIKRYAAAVGQVLIEVIDDDIRQKVTQKTIWAGYVTQIDLNDSGDVQSYTVEYDAWDPALKESYKFKKSVDKQTYKYFRGDRPYAFSGRPAEIAHNLGFCPAVWLQHSDDGTPAFHDFAKVNHANSLASHLHDNIHKEIESGKVIFSDEPGAVQVISGGTKNKDGSVAMHDARLDRVLLAMKNPGSISDLSGLLKLSEAEPYLKYLLVSFGEDYPELEYRQIIKENGSLSGLALERLLTPAQNRLDRFSPNYDSQIIKLRQMQIAVGGRRAKQGWFNLTDAQRTFSPFGLDSYDRGLLNFNIKPSKLIELSEDELIDLQGKKLDNANKAQGIYPLKERIKLTGKTDEEADAYVLTLGGEAGLLPNENGQI